MKATVFVRLKPEVLDPQGRAVEHALGRLGFEGVHSVRVGKLIELDLDETRVSTQVAREKLQAMCHELLANPVIEDFEVTID